MQQIAFFNNHQTASCIFSDRQVGLRDRCHVKIPRVADIYSPPSSHLFLRPDEYRY
ncbi:hypothetical protein [Nostoc sp. DSM 114161]|uniref:hypothetical protein n=1 Tax=Nostoc sp. DSM 114161 TaxID=3440143 RepID=UPI00404684CF